MRRRAVVWGLLVATYGPLLALRYLWSDDYFMVAEIAEGHSLLGWISHVGRPLYGVALQVGLSLVHGEMRLLRAAGLLGLLLLTMPLTALCAPLVGRAAATWLSAVVVLGTAFQVYVSFSICFAFPYAATLSAAAALVLSRIDFSAPAGWRPLALAAGLQCAAMLIYQPAATVIAGASVVSLVFAEAPTAVWRRRAAAFLAVFGLSCGVAWVAIQAGGLVFGDGSTYARAAVSHDVVGKLRWFTAEVLVNAFSAVTARPSRALAATVLVAWSLALLQGTAEHRLRRLLTGVALVPLAYLPNLLASDFYASYRTEAGLDVLIALGLGLGATQWLQRRLDSRWNAAVPMVALAIAAPIALSQTLRYVALPAVAERQHLTEQLVGLGSTQAVCLIPPGEMDSASPVVRYDEFGRASTFADWAQGHAVEVLTGVARERVAVGDCVAAAGARVVDMRGLHLARLR